MKILQVIPYFCFGGAETMCENLTYALRQARHSVTVVSLYGERTPISLRMEEAGVNIRYLDKKLGLDVSMVSKLAKILKEEAPDAVHTHLDVVKYAVAAAKLAGVRHCVHTVHNVAEEEAEGKLQKMINGTYFRLGWSTPVALSPKVQESIVSFYGMKKECVPVIYNGIDLSRCIPKESYEAETVRIVHIGRFNRQKNHRGLLDAFALLLKTCPNCCLDLLGDGELRPEMERYVKELGVEDKVRFLGNQQNVYPYLHAADIFLLPSHFEGMPMTIIEAMGTGLPVVATRVGGVPDMFTDGKSGILTSEAPEVVAEALIRLAEDGMLRERMGRNALVESGRFSSQTMAEHYARVYQGERL